MKQVNLMHIFIVGPLLMYIGNKKDKTPQIAFNMLLTLILLLPFIVRFPNFNKITYTNIINSSHYLVWIPLFGYIAYKGNKLDNYWWTLLSLLGVTVISIHIFLLLNKFGYVKL